MTSHPLIRGAVPRRAFALAAATAFAVATSLCPARADSGAPIRLTQAIGGPAALVIHGGDRSLAAVPAPAGPPQLNLAALGAFPNDLVVRGTRAYAVCSGADAIFVIDLAAGAVVDTIPCGTGANPWSLVFTSDTRAYVSRLNFNDVLALDLPAGSAAAAIPVGRSPEGLAVSGGRVFVANSGFNFATFGYDPGTVSVIDPVSNSVTATLPVGLNPQSLATAPNGEVHALCSGNYFSIFGRAFVIDPATPAVVDSLELGASPGLLAIDAAGHAYASDYFAGVLKYDALSRVVLRDGANAIPVGTGAAGLDFGGGFTWVCVFGDDQLVALDAADDVAGVFSMGDGPQDVAFYTPAPPIAVTLAAFTATADAEGVTLAWRTADERAHAGFAVERATAAEGPWRRLTEGLIPPAADGRYTFHDAEAFGSGSATPDAPLWYRLVAVDRAGGQQALAPLAVERPAPGGLALAAPAPNPARGPVTIAFRLAEAGPARVTLFDASGRAVARPLERTLPAGPFEFSLEPTDAAGRRLAAGVYFIRLESRGQAQTRRLVFSR